MQHKKLAILVGGEFREFVSCYPTWKELTDIDHDLFISTWDQTEEQNIKMGINISRRITPEDIRSVCPNAIINIETISPVVSLSRNSYKQLYHWRKLFTMLFQSDYCYDAVLLTRPDIFLKLNNFQDYLQNISDDRIYGIGSVQHEPPPIHAFILDVLFLGKPDRMVEAFRGLPFYATDVKDIHYHLAKHFIINDIYVQPIPSPIIEWLIFRSSMIGHKNADWKTLQTMAVEWLDKKHRRINLVVVMSSINTKMTKIVSKPWGHETWIADGTTTPYALKRILFNAGNRTSLQVHEYKVETNYVLSGTGKLYKSKEIFDVASFLDHGMTLEQVEQYESTLEIIELCPGTVFNVQPGYVHRVVATTDLEFIEASTTELDDVIRLQDDAGRTHGRIQSEHQ